MAASSVSFRTSRILIKVLNHDVRGTPNQRTFIGGIIGASKDSLSHKERRIIGFSQEQMYRVVSDTESYPEFLPWCRKFRRLEKQGCVERVQLTVGFPPFEETYTSKVTVEAPSKVHSFSEEGTFFKDLDALWTFEDCGKDSCVLSFRIVFKMKSILQAPIANVFLKQTAITMSRAFIDRAEQLYGKPSCAERKL